MLDFATQMVIPPLLPAKCCKKSLVNRCKKHHPELLHSKWETGAKTQRGLYLLLEKKHQSPTVPLHPKITESKVL